MERRRGVLVQRTEYFFSIDIEADFTYFILFYFYFTFFFFFASSRTLSFFRPTLLPVLTYTRREQRTKWIDSFLVTYILLSILLSLGSHVFYYDLRNKKEIEKEEKLLQKIAKTR